MAELKDTRKAGLLGSWREPRWADLTVEMMAWTTVAATAVMRAEWTVSLMVVGRVLSSAVSWAKMMAGLSVDVTAVVKAGLWDLQ